MSLTVCLPEKCNKFDFKSDPLSATSRAPSYESQQRSLVVDLGYVKKVME